MLRTRWYLKNVRRVTQPKPMCRNICITLLGDAPASNMAKHNRKFPAAICVPGMFGWLLHVRTCLLHAGLWQVVVTTAMVPSCCALTSGLSALQVWQKVKSKSSCERNTMCLGSARRFWLLSSTFKLETQMIKNTSWSWLVPQSPSPLPVILLSTL